MAKIEGTQTIPSEIEEQYSEILTPKLSGSQVRTRCPFTRPKSRAGGPNESDAQKAQRDRFRTARDRFNDTDYSERQRWYESAPVWNSFLWYYNWFMLSALMGVTGIPGGTTAVIKSIQHINVTIGSGTATGTGTFSSVDSDKAVVMMNGSTIAYGQSGDYPYVAIIYPYLKEIADTSLKMCWSVVPTDTEAPQQAVISVDVIEYI